MVLPCNFLELSDRIIKSEYLNYLKWTENIIEFLTTLEDEQQALRIVSLGLEIDLQLGAKLAGAVKLEFQEKAIAILLEDERPDWLDMYLIRIAKSGEGITRFIEIIFDNHPSHFISDRPEEILEKSANSHKADLAISNLSDALRNSDWQIRAAAANTLGELYLFKDIERIIADLINALEDPEQFVRFAAARSLGKMAKVQGVQKAIPKLGQMLKDEKHFLGRCDIAEALGELSTCEGIEDVIPILIDSLNKEDLNVRQSAALALGQLYVATRNETIFENLNRILITEEDFSLPSTVSVALEQAGLKHKAISNLLNSLQSLNSNFKWKAARALDCLIDGDEDFTYIIPNLLEVLKDVDSNVRMYAISILGNISPDDVITELLLALEDQEPLVRRYAISALKKVKSEIDISLVLQGLEDNDVDVKRSIIELICEKNIIAGIPKLLEILEDDASELREDAAMTLGKLNAEVAVPALLRTLESDDSFLRYQSASALGMIGSKSAIPNLRRAFENETSYGLAKVVEALGNIRDVDNKDIFIQGLESEDKRVRQYSAKALAKCYLPEAINGLVEFLEVSEDFIREWAAETMCGLADFWASDGRMDLVASMLPIFSRLPMLADWDTPAFENPEALEALAKIQKICGFYSLDL
ncbi:HEAT repeat domain-containing protein [Pseudanabaena sp. UWO310]|uniref:HEAT repeat domain-containing protein n=1 Tax=Pseudanabaena sp. UWO310 TaxID=2480795 RepID=UPI001160A4D2|nr:HEAT repeat domain-containing protein [Pseudanabaena sp. UWO310]TYQ25132.1 HEAT repeat domain-containing protein [Pseudanabaena sp. UWO310]